MFYLLYTALLTLTTSFVVITPSPLARKWENKKAAIHF